MHRHRPGAARDHPVILVFGIYILLNGHLSPGGGFSGGSILAAGLMLFAMVWGDGAASAVLRPRRLQTVVLCSLGFYCLAKSYSFFTGANHLHSIISPGTPGTILSGGLILPLNVAVGVKNILNHEYYTRTFDDNNKGKYVGEPRTLYVQTSVAF